MLHLILPTTGPQPMLRDMLSSLATHTDPCHLVVVLNTREDWRRAAVRPLLECLIDNRWNVTLVERHERIGYVRACNLGWRALEAADDDLLAVLNDDLIFKGRWVEPLQQALQGGAHLLGPSLQYVGADGKWGQPSGPPYIEGWCLVVCVGDIAEKDPTGSWQYPWNLFDPQFEPQLCEDMDLGLRIGGAFGRDAIRQVDIPVDHVRSATIGENREPYWSENRRKLIEKWQLGGKVAVTKREQAEKLAAIHYEDPAVKEINYCEPEPLAPTPPQPVLGPAGACHGSATYPSPAATAVATGPPPQPTEANPCCEDIASPGNDRLPVVKSIRHTVQCGNCGCDLSQESGEICPRCGKLFGPSRLRPELRPGTYLPAQAAKQGWDYIP